MGHLLAMATCQENITTDTSALIAKRCLAIIERHGHTEKAETAIVDVIDALISRLVYELS